MKDFKRKLLELWNLGFDAKRIKKYFEDNRETWSDINLSKIEVYYFSKDTKDRFFATRKPLDTSCLLYTSYWDKSSGWYWYNADG